MTGAALRYNRVTMVALLVMIAGGLQAYMTMPRAMDPGFTIRTAMVQTFFPGASPVRVEELVTDRLEEAVQEIPELDNVASQSKTGTSVLLVNLKESVPPERVQGVWDKLRRKLQAAARDLPEGAIGPLVNDEFGDVFGIVIGLRGDGFDNRALRKIGERARKRFLRFPDVAKVELFGVEAERIFIEYQPARLAELGLSPGMLTEYLKARNIVIPGGALNVGPERIVLEPSGNFESLDDLRQTVLQVPGARELVYLGDIATVRRGTVEPPRQLVAVEGTRGLSLAISMRDGGNLTELGAQVRGALAAMEARYPWGVQFDVLAFLPDKVDDKIDDFVGNLGQSVGLVLAVMLLTLGLRTGLVVASLIPSAIVAAFLLMGFFGVGVDQMSLSALILALGLLVDNAIVMAESILVEMEAGKTPVEAALASAAELRIPLLTSSLTTSAAFLPIYLAESAVGEYTASLFIVVTITLLSSWVLALTVVPLLSVWFLRVKKSKREGPAGPLFESPLWRAFRAVLVLALRLKPVSLALVAAVFAVSMLGFQYVPFIFFPASDQTYATVDIEMPPGTTIQRTREVVAAYEAFLETKRGEPGDEPGTWRTAGARNWVSYVGKGGPRFVLSFNPEPPADNYASVIIDHTDRAAVDTLVQASRTFFVERFPEASATAKPLGNGPPVKAPVSYRLYAGDDARLLELARAVAAKLRVIDGVHTISDNWGRRTKKFAVRIDQARARRAGVTSQDVALSLQTNLSGFTSTEYRDGSDVIPITLRSNAAERTDVGKIEGLDVFSSSTGRTVPLMQIADVELAWEPAVIHRRNQQRMAVVQGFLDPGATSADVNAVMEPWLTAKVAEFGPDYRFELGGDVEASAKGNTSVGDKMPIAFLLILLLLVGQFNSLRRPAIILLTIPLGLIGVIAGLLIADSYFGFMTLLGIVSLSGIVINNAIVLIERIAYEIDRNGLSPAQGVVVAVQRRTRPILLTTATTIGGLIPLWLGGGPMFEPLAVSILFGLLFATALTLGVVPLLYATFFRVSYRGYTYAPVER